MLLCPSSSFIHQTAFFPMPLIGFLFLNSLINKSMFCKFLYLRFSPFLSKSMPRQLHLVLHLQGLFGSNVRIQYLKSSCTCKTTKPFHPLFIQPLIIKSFSPILVNVLILETKCLTPKVQWRRVLGLGL